MSTATRNKKTLLASRYLASIQRGSSNNNHHNHSKNASAHDGATSSSSSNSNHNNDNGSKQNVPLNSQKDEGGHPPLMPSDDCIRERNFSSVSSNKSKIMNKVIQDRKKNFGMNYNRTSAVNNSLTSARDEVKGVETVPNEDDVVKKSRHKFHASKQEEQKKKEGINGSPVFVESPPKSSIQEYKLKLFKGNNEVEMPPWNHHAANNSEGRHIQKARAHLKKSRSTPIQSNSAAASVSDSNANFSHLQVPSFKKASPSSAFHRPSQNTQQNQPPPQEKSSTMQSLEETKMKKSLQQQQEELPKSPPRQRQGFSHRKGEHKSWQSSSSSKKKGWGDRNQGGGLLGIQRKPQYDTIDNIDDPKYNSPPSTTAATTPSFDSSYTSMPMSQNLEELSVEKQRKIDEEEESAASSSISGLTNPTLDNLVNKNSVQDDGFLTFNQRPVSAEPIFFGEGKETRENDITFSAVPNQAFDDAPNFFHTKDFQNECEQDEDEVKGDDGWVDFNATTIAGTSNHEDPFNIASTFDDHPSESHDLSSNGKHNYNKRTEASTDNRKAIHQQKNIKNNDGSSSFWEPFSSPLSPIVHRSFSDGAGVRRQNQSPLSTPMGRRSEYSISPTNHQQQMQRPSSSLSPSTTKRSQYFQELLNKSSDSKSIKSRSSSVGGGKSTTAANSTSLSASHSISSSISASHSQQFRLQNQQQQQQDQHHKWKHKSLTSQSRSISPSKSITSSRASSRERCKDLIHPNMLNPVYSPIKKQLFNRSPSEKSQERQMQEQTTSDSFSAFSTPRKSSSHKNDNCQQQERKQMDTPEFTQRLRERMNQRRVNTPNITENQINKSSCAVAPVQSSFLEHHTKSSVMILDDTFEDEMMMNGSPSPSKSSSSSKLRHQRVPPGVIDVDDDNESDKEDAEDKKIASSSGTSNERRRSRSRAKSDAGVDYIYNAVSTRLSLHSSQQSLSQLSTRKRSKSKGKSKSIYPPNPRSSPSTKGVSHLTNTRTLNNKHLTVKGGGHAAIYSDNANNVSGYTSDSSARYKFNSDAFQDCLDLD